MSAFTRCRGTVAVILYKMSLLSLRLFFLSGGGVRKSCSSIEGAGGSGRKDYEVDGRKDY